MQPVQRRDATARAQTLTMQPPRERTTWLGRSWDQTLTFADQVFGPSSRGVRNVVRGKLRLALVAGLVGVSLMLVAVTLALNASVQQRLAIAQAQIGTGITISTAGNGGFGGGGGSTDNQYITAAQVHTVESTTGVTSVSEYVTTRDQGGAIKGSVSVPTNNPTFGGGDGSPFFGAVDGTIAPRVQGLLPGQSPLTLANGVALKLKSGRNFAAADATAPVALTSLALAKANGYSLGSTVALNGTTVKLVGLFSSGDAFDDDNIVVPFQTAQKIYGITGATGMTAYADNISDVDNVASTLRTALGGNLYVVAQSQIYTDTIDALHSTQSSITTTLVISALVAALVIVFAVFLIVRERTQEIGLLRAIGASQRQIVQQFAAESLALGAVAAAVATVLIALFSGTIASQFATSASATGGRIFIRGGGAFGPGGGGFGGFASRTLSAGLTPGTALLVFALGIGLAILASVIPAWYVSRVRPAEALRSVG
jgi:ABC-type antimicrobial peptide transport system permease subunit